MMKEEKQVQLSIRQEPLKEVLVRKLNDVAIWKNLFSLNICQLLAIWIMLLMQFISEYKFSIGDYISNLLAFDIVACATNLSDIFGKENSKTKEISTTFTIGVLTIVICFASILYGLSLICDFIDLHLKTDLVMALSILFTLIVILISMLQAARR